MTVRKTISGDMPALKRIVDATNLFPSDMLEGMLEGFLSGDASDLWLSFEHDDTIKGFCYAVPEEMTEGTWNMLAIAVHPHHQGQGVGAAIIAALEERLRLLGQRLLIVDTSGSDTFVETRKFYAKNGYNEEARIRDFWSEGDDKIVFRKKL